MYYLNIFRTSAEKIQVHQNMTLIHVNMKLRSTNQVCSAVRADIRSNMSVYRLQNGVCRGFSQSTYSNSAVANTDRSKTSFLSSPFQSITHQSFHNSCCIFWVADGVVKQSSTDLPSRNRNHASIDFLTTQLTQFTLYLPPPRSTAKALQHTY